MVVYQAILKTTLWPQRRHKKLPQLQCRNYTTGLFEGANAHDLFRGV